MTVNITHKGQLKEESMKSPVFKRIVKYAGNIITILSIAFVVKVMLSLDINISVITNHVTFILFIICCSIMVFTVFLLAYGWRTVLSSLAGTKIPFRDVCFIYAKANMGKYLPGNVMHYIERNLFAGSLGLDQKAVLLSTLLEITGLISVCTLFGILTMGSQTASVLKLILKRKYLIVCVSFIMLAFILILVFCKKIEKFFAELPWKLLAAAFLRTLPLYFFSILSGGCALAIIFGAFTRFGMTLGNILMILSAYTISWVIGFIIPGSPGGIGVREFVLLFLLKGRYYEEYIFTCILIHRFASVVGDILAYWVALTWNKRGCPARCPRE